MSVFRDFVLLLLRYEESIWMTERFHQRGEAEETAGMTGEARHTWRSASDRRRSMSQSGRGQWGKLRITGTDLYSWWWETEVHQIWWLAPLEWGSKGKGRAGFEKKWRHQVTAWGSERNNWPQTNAGAVLGISPYVFPWPLSRIYFPFLFT